jgi:PAS domain S-box-containing protein
MSTLASHQAAGAVHDASYLESLVENSDYAIVSKTLDGTILFWNDAATEMYGYTADEAIGQPVEIVIPKDRHEEELRIRRQIAEGIPVRHTETMRRRKDGSLVAVSLSISPVKNQSGEIIGAAGFALDVTERNLAFESQQLLAAVVLNSDDAIVSKTLDGEILNWNDAATRMYGYTAEEAQGQPIEIVIPENLREEELEIRRRIAEGTPVHRYETVRRRKDGRLVEVALSLSPVKNAAGEIIGAAGFARDITERKHQQRLADVVIHSGDAVVVKNLDTGLIEFWNEAASRTYGYTEAEAVGQPIDILIPEDLRAADLDQRSRIKQGEDIPHHETIRRRKDGTLIHVSLSISPLRDAAGHVTSAARIARDISEGKKLEKERQHAIGLLERFVDFTAHDFKTPMHHAHSSAQQARDLIGDDADPKVLKWLDRVITNTDWMCKRTEGLQKVASLEGQRTLRQLAHTALAFDESVAMLCSVDHAVRHAEVTRGDLPVLHSDHHLLYFLFHNLVQNACKYRREDETARVHLSAQRDADGWEFRVTDNGRGVRPEHATRIFDPYTREPGNTRVWGLGIGLHFCKLIVEWHGGRIWVEPGPEGVGSVFKFTIPDHDR